MHADVIGLAGLQNARTEFVKARIILRRFDLIDGSAFGVRLHIFPAAIVFAECKEINVEGHFAVGNVEHEIDQFGWLP